MDDMSKKIDILLAASSRQEPGEAPSTSRGSGGPQPSTSSAPPHQSSSVDLTAPDQESQQLLTQSVERHIQQVMNTAASNNPGEHLLSVAMPLDVSVDDKLKSAIWALDYIEFQKLKSSDDVSTAYDIDIRSPSGNQTLHIDTGKRSKPIEHISQWFEAFHTFMSVYCQRYPEDAMDMLSYQYTVKSIATDGGDWLKYDTQFRRLFKGRRVPWNKPHVELFMRCSRRAFLKQPTPFFNSYRAPTPQFQPRNPQQPRLFRPFRPSTPQTTQKSRHPKGFCYQFHDYGKCSRQPCSYIHKCYSPGCGENHPIF